MKKGGAMTRIYHVGICLRGRTAVIQATVSKDYLSCELYDYFGERVTTKTNLRAKRYELLTYLKSVKPQVYDNCLYAVVE